VYQYDMPFTKCAVNAKVETRMKTAAGDVNDSQRIMDSALHRTPRKESRADQPGAVTVSTSRMPLVSFASHSR